MLVTQKYDNYPVKTIIEDMLQREGPADENSFSPFDGIYSYFSAKTYNHRLPSDWFEKAFGNNDYDPTRTNENEIQTEDYNIIGENAGFKLLEEVQESAEYRKKPELYIKALMNKNAIWFSENNIRKFALYQHSAVMDDDGDMHSESEILTEDRDSDEYNDAKKIVTSIAYDMLKLRDISMEHFYIDMFTILIAAKKIENMGLDSKEIRHWVNANGIILKYRPSGELIGFTDHFSDNKMDKYRNAVAVWRSDAWNELTKQVKELWYSISEKCEQIRVDLGAIDSMKYLEILDKLAINRVMTNAEYIVKFGKIDIELKKLFDTDTALFDKYKNTVKKSKQALQKPTNVSFSNVEEKIINHIIENSECVTDAELSKYLEDDPEEAPPRIVGQAILRITKEYYIDRGLYVDRNYNPIEYRTWAYLFVFGRKHLYAISKNYEVTFESYDRLKSLEDLDKYDYRERKFI